VKYGAEICPSAVIPEEPPAGDEIEIVLGVPELPYVAYISAILLSSRFDPTERSLVLSLKAFRGHYSETTVLSPWEPRSVSVNGAKLNKGWSFSRSEGICEVKIGFIHESTQATVMVHF